MGALYTIAKNVQIPFVQKAIVKILKDQIALHSIASFWGANSDVRKAAFKKLTVQRELADVVKFCPDKDLRKAAFEKLTSQTFFADVAIWASDKDFCIAAVEKLTEQKLLAEVVRKRYEYKDEVRYKDVRLAALNKLTDQSLIKEIYSKENDSDIRAAAAKKLNNQPSPIKPKEILNKESDIDKCAEVRNLTDKFKLANIARKDSDSDVRKAAVENKYLDQQYVLIDIARKDNDSDVRKAAVNKLTDQSALEYVAKNDKDGNVRRAAKAKLKGMSAIEEQMKAIKHNPYRVAGLLVGANAKEKERQLRRLKQFIEAGQAPEADFSFSDKNLLVRTVESVSEAASKLNLDKDRMSAALFWFYEDGETDRQAFDAMKEGNFDQAVKIWKELTASKISKANASAFSNLSTLYLSGFLEGDYNTEKLFEEGLALKLKFLDSAYGMELKQKATDETYIVTTNELQLMFLNQIRDEIEKEQVEITLDLFLLIIMEQSFSAKDDFLKSFIQKPMEQIESKINETKAKRKENPANAVEAAKSLLKETKDSLSQFEFVLKSSDIRYTTAVDDIAEEALQCGIEYFNCHLNKSDGQNKNQSTKDDFVKSSIDICQKAGALAIGDNLKKRIRENIDVMKGFYEKKAIAEQTEKLKNLIEEYGQRDQTIDRAKQMIFAAKPLLSGLKMTVGDDKELNEIYISFSTRIASDALGMSVAEINELQEKNSDTELFKQKVNNALELMTLIDSLDSTPDFKTRFNQNRDILKNLKENFDIEMLKRLINEYGQLPQTAANAKEFLSKAKPLLEKINRSSGVKLDWRLNVEKNEVYLEWSARIAAIAQGMCVAEINKLQENNDNFDLFQKAVNKAVEVMDLIEKMDLSRDFKNNNLKPNRDALENLKKSFVIEELKRLINEFAERKQTVDGADRYLSYAIPILEKIKSSYGAKNEAYLTLSTRVAADAQGTCIKIINEEQEKIRSRYELSSLKDILDPVFQVILKIELKVDMQKDFKGNFLKNKEALSNLYKQVTGYDPPTSLPSSSSSSSRGGYFVLGQDFRF